VARTLFIKTYGCQMNVYDSARMADVLAPLGYGPVETADEADLVILNTCHIREKAAEKVFSELGRLKALKDARARQGRALFLAVGGCVAQAEGEEILARAPQVDLVFGPQTYHRLPEMVARLERGQGRLLDTDFPPEPKFDHLPAQGAQGPSAFLAIQEGCDKFCTYCVVPYTRGAEYARPAQAIRDEARRLVDQGAREITLLGQNVNAWQAEGWSLARLLDALAEIEGLERLRYTTSHPSAMSDDLIGAHRDNPKLMPFLHLPVQSGSDSILRAMNRGHDARDYRRLVDRLRQARPDLALSSDFIVGFPGETEADFQASLDLIAGVGFAQSFSFKYSPRPGTPAAHLPHPVPEAVKAERLDRLQALIDSQARAHLDSCVGRVLPVLLDRPGRHPGQLAGRGPTMQPVHLAAPPSLFGQVVAVRIRESHANSLAGELAA